MKHYFKKMRGNGLRNSPRKPLSEIIWSWLGSFAGIYAIWLLNSHLGIQEDANLFLIGSFGATAVLVYGAPMGELSQPRNLVGGHVISAIAGIVAYKLLPEHAALAAALGVSVAIAAMLLTDTLHPPGGATALIAVIGGKSIHDLGFMYVFSPVLAGVLIMLAVALIVNNLSSNTARHYPKHWF
jgi:CBS domain-containing membrane protein